MKLCEAGLQDKAQWEKKGYKLPKYNRAEMISKTKESPFWVHFGAGNIFRAFQANAVGQLLDNGLLDRGLVVVEGYDYEIISKSYRPNDNYSILVTLKADGNVEKTVVGSIAESCILDSADNEEFTRLQEIFRAESLQIASFTITEKGYLLADNDGNFYPGVKEDIEAGPNKPVSYIGKVASLLHTRYVNGELPIAFVSMDNCSHNGDKLYAAISGFAREWADRGLVSAGFVDYINDKTRVSFPWTMIDKITPRPDETVERMLADDGLEDLAPIVTSKNTYVAPFVNAEETEYLVIEDVFPNGRPKLEDAGFIFTDRETVDKVERMKVCTCLNPLHTALAVYGCILGYTKISDEMKDADLVGLVERIGYKEGLPVVVNPGVLDPKAFIDTVLQVRVPNPFMPDTPQRIATDTSQKLPIRFGETIKNYINTGLNLEDLRLIPLVFAGWLRYLCAVNDEGESFVPSPDPLFDKASSYLQGVKLGDSIEIGTVSDLLSDSSIFGVDLIEIGMADKVVSMFNEMNIGKGAIRATLKKYVEMCNE